MRVASNIDQPEVRQDQFEMLVNVISSIKDQNDLRDFLKCLITRSELAYLGQRLSIMKMLLQDFNYNQIKGEISTSTGTITHAKLCLDDGGEKIKKLILSCKHSPVKKKQYSKSSNDKWINPKMPGAIRL